MCVFVRKIVGRYFPIIRVSAEKIVGVGIEGNTDGLGKKKNYVCHAKFIVHFLHINLWGGKRSS